MNSKSKHNINWLVRVFFIFIILFVFQRGIVVALPCEIEYNFESQNFEHSALIKDDVNCQIIDLHFQSEFVLFSEVSEPENTCFIGGDDIAAKGAKDIMSTLELRPDIIL